MYAMLGDVRFEFLASFNNLEETHKALFGKHQVLVGRPRLQGMGNDLTGYRFGVKLHWMLGNPDTAYNGLIAAKESQQAQALVYGSGRFVGWFVIESVTGRTLLQDPQGRTAIRELDVELTEFVGDPNNPLPTPGIGGGLSPLLSLLPESVRGTVSTVADAVQTGVRIYRAAEAVIDDAQTLITRAKEVRDTPSSAFGLIGDALNLGNTAITQLGQLPVIGAKMGDLSGVTDFLRYSGAAAQSMQNAVSTLQSGVNSGNIGTWLDTGSAFIEQATDGLTNAAIGAQLLAGWLAGRKDGGASS